MALTRIRAAILSGKLTPGARISQEELADRLGVSRAPVRQALSVLEQEGLVQRNRWRSTIVAPLDASLIRDVYHFRGALEQFVAGTLAQRTGFDPGPLQTVLAAGKKAAATGSVTRLVELDMRFHTALCDAVGNRILSDVMRAQWVQCRRVMGLTLSISGYPRKVWEEHEAILEAIAAQDPENARRLSEAHTTHAGAKLLENLAQQGRMSSTAISSSR
jgi:DNA-binding GntR family transcriptional regulator